ncbi:MAG: sugar-transfer associated ATP-grasp domain-containing protein [Myxococcota bacterium]|nr:sugar-transfer associated ATP-grasp domain-containing protein [Myxococcota bacterium]
MKKRDASCSRDDVLGINRRNLECVAVRNPRRNFRNADDKVLAKEILGQAGLPTPETVYVVDGRDQIGECLERMRARSGCAIKPAEGYGGSGVKLVWPRGDGWQDAAGEPLSDHDLTFHMASILSGMFALDRLSDRVLVEELVEDHEVLQRIHESRGVSDLRLIVSEGRLVMAMLRLPTKRSGGAANLHAGGIGVGIDLEAGRTTHAIQDDRPIDAHPDTGHLLEGVELPFWAEIAALSPRLNDLFELGYLGADVVIDARRGPLLLEVNARPGLSIQLANREGLRALLESDEA